MGNLRTFQTTGNWSDATKWADNTKPVAGDAVVIANGVVCTINENTPALASVVVGETTWPSIGTNGDAGTGRCVVSVGVTVTFDTMNAGNCGSNGFFKFEGGAGTSCTLNGHVKGGSATGSHGCRNYAAGTVTITTCTGGSAAHAYGCTNNADGTLTITTCTSGSATGSHGCYNYSTGTVTITTCTGGSAEHAYGCTNNADGTLNITTCTGGSATGSHGCLNYAAGTVTITTCTGGSATGAYGCYNYSTGTVTITTCTGGSAAHAYGCYLYNNATPTGRCYITGSVKAGFDGVNPVNGLYNNVTNAGYHFLAYGAKLYDKDGTEETSSYTAINSIAGIGYGWLITAEIDSAADFAAINNLVGDANVSFVQTGDFEVTTPANIGSVAAFLGSYTGYDAVAQRQRAVTFTYGDGSQTGIASLFQSNTGTLSRIKCTFAVNLDEEESTDAAIVHTNNSGGSVVDCVSGGTINADDAIGVCHTNAGLVKTSYTVAEDLGGNPLQTIRTNIGTVTNCYHLHIVDTQGVTVLKLPQMQGKGMNLDYINVWQEDIGGRDNTWLPYLRDGRYIKRRREPVGQL